VTGHSSGADAGSGWDGAARRTIQVDYGTSSVHASVLAGFPDQPETETKTINESA
jgi:hypothetical protein